MRHLIKNSILVVVSYSLALSAPAYAKPADSFVVVKNYVNGGGKKTFKGLVEKMEGELPVTFYDQALKKTRGPEGKLWFQAAKLANNYVYLRFNNSKVFIRVTEDKGQTVFYANGIKIAENDFRNVNVVQNKLFMAYLAGLPSKKSAFYDIFGFNRANAAAREVAPADRTDSPVAPVDQCALIAERITRALNESPPDTRTIQEQCETPQARECNLNSACENAPAAGATAGNNNRMGLWLFLGAALLILLLAFRNKKKKNNGPDEVPEDENGVGRTPTPPPGGGINCGGEGAQCPGQPYPGTPAPGTPAPGTPTPPPSYVPPVSNDPNYYGMPVNNTTRPQGTPTGNPVFKTRGR